MQDFDDRRFGGLVDLGDEVALALAGHLQVFEVERGAIDDLAGAARRPDDDVERWMHGLGVRDGRLRPPDCFGGSRILI